MSNDNASSAQIVNDVIRRRKTSKLLRDPASSRPATLTDAHLAEVNTMIESAARAPFHKLADKAHRDRLTSVVPWRFYVINKPEQLNAWLQSRAEAHPDSEWDRAWKTKIPHLIGAAAVLVMVTWLPDAPTTDSTPELTDANREHISAAAAAVQNLLLSAESMSWYSYWSSGGILNSTGVFSHLGIPPLEQFLGAIFLTPDGFDFDDNRPGALHDKRGDPADWCRWVNLD